MSNANPDTVSLIRRWVDAHGMASAAARFQASESSLTRLLAGMPVRRGTLAMVEAQAGLVRGDATIVVDRPLTLRRDP